MFAIVGEAYHLPSQSSVSVVVSLLCVPMTCALCEWFRTTFFMVRALLWNLWRHVCKYFQQKLHHFSFTLVPNVPVVRTWDRVYLTFKILVETFLLIVYGFLVKNPGYLVCKESLSNYQEHGNVFILFDVIASQRFKICVN